MATGLLKVEGTIDLSQFWPTKGSDADTVTVHADANKFFFRERPGSAFKKTAVFQDCMVKGKYGNAKPYKNGKFTVRLQGLDAPELHYQPQLSGQQWKTLPKEQTDRFKEINEKYRQNLGETTTVKLRKYLEQAGQDPLPCRFETAVDHPDEVCDTYCRFVGDIIVSANGKEQNINQWLVENGLAYPSFYNSMSEDEILVLKSAGDVAYSNDAALWVKLLDGVGEFNWSLTYRKPSEGPVHDEAADTGDVTLPKLYRRSVQWEACRYAGIYTSAFWAFVDSKRDYCYLTDDFLAQGCAATPRNISDFLHLDGFFDLWPEDIVFIESSSKTVAPGGGEVSW